jgi:hypothetical protein
MGGQHSHVTDAGANIEDTLAEVNTCVTEESFGGLSKARSLANEAIVLRIAVAKRILGSVTGLGHFSGGCYHASI